MRPEIGTVETLGDVYSAIQSFAEVGEREMRAAMESTAAGPVAQMVAEHAAVTRYADKGDRLLEALAAFDADRPEVARVGRQPVVDNLRRYVDQARTVAAECARVIDNETPKGAEHGSNEERRR